jgi:dihydroorotate dehydrogenase
MLDVSRLPKYDPTKSYLWNYGNAPDPVGVDVPPVAGSWKFCGLPVSSPLGMPAGPLLNGRWVLYYASRGFDVLTYKTVRSVERECYPLPNLLPVRTGPLTGGECDLTTAGKMEGSWAVSFGMPSKAPDVWRRDIEWTRNNLPTEKILSVSVVGSIEPDWTIDDLANDYARCARWAVEAGAEVIETNFSCPNVATCDGQLYQEHKSAALVAARVREAIGRVPFVVKIGHLTQADQAVELLDAIGPYIDGLAMTNSVACTVRAEDGSYHFGGERRGICGEATRQASLAQTKLFAAAIAEGGKPIDTIGVGGAGTAQHVREYLAAGATAVHIATAAMVDPFVGVRIRGALDRE